MPVPDAPPPYRTIVFDCDSTLSAMEGVEELAPGSPELRRLTDAAMAGEVRLEDVFARRLELVRPARADLDRVGEAYVARALPNALELVRALHELGKRVAIVSGGLLPAVLRLAHHLGVVETHAVDVRFDERGHYLGFDEASPLARSGGKVDVLASIAGRAGARPLALVGDGATDLEAAHLAARFVAFGGVTRRETVFAAARTSTTRADFAALVPLLLDEAERERLRSSGRYPTLFAPAGAH